MAARLNLLRLAVVVAGLILMSGCSTQDTLPDASLWRLSSLDGKPPIEGSRITLNLVQSESRVFGNAGCNQYTTGYGGDVTAPRFSMVGLTKRFCNQPAGVMEQEEHYVRRLRSATAFELRRGKLEMVLPEGELSFERVVVVDR